MPEPINTKGIVAYICHTETSAFNLKDLILSQGYRTFKYHGEKRVISDYPFTDEEIAKKAGFYISRTDEVAEIEVRLFERLE